MSQKIWALKSGFYQIARKNPLSYFFLTNERKGLKKLISELDISNHSAILDLGVGRGNSLSLLPRSEQIISIDNCFDMVFRTRQENPDLLFIQADACALPFADNYFDLISCVGLSEYIQDINNLLNDINRVLARKKSVIFTISPKNPLTFLRFLLGHKLYPYSDREICNLFESHNFIVVDKVKTMLQFQYLITKK